MGVLQWKPGSFLAPGAYCRLLLSDSGPGVRTSPREVVPSKRCEAMAAWWDMLFRTMSPFRHNTTSCRVGRKGERLRDALLRASHLRPRGSPGITSWAHLSPKWWLLRLVLWQEPQKQELGPRKQTPRIRWEFVLLQFHVSTSWSNNK